MRGRLCTLQMATRAPSPTPESGGTAERAGPLGLEIQVAGGFVESELERSLSSGGGGATISCRTPALALLAGCEAPHLLGMYPGLGSWSQGSQPVLCFLNLMQVLAHMLHCMGDFDFITVLS